MTLGLGLAETSPFGYFARFRKCYVRKGGAPFGEPDPSGGG